MLLSADGGSTFATYYYLRNAQNDVISLIDSTGATVVQYVYDSWGKLIATTGSLATSLGANQPFRCRGYVYDSETGWYYLQSRYYNPTLCRFISADVLLSTGQGVLGHNAYAYCLNNPIIGADAGGNVPYNTMMTDGVGSGADIFSSYESQAILAFLDDFCHPTDKITVQSDYLYVRNPGEKTIYQNVVFSGIVSVGDPALAISILSLLGGLADVAGIPYIGSITSAAEQILELLNQFEPGDYLEFKFTTVTRRDTPEGVIYTYIEETYRVGVIGGIGETTLYCKRAKSHVYNSVYNLT